MTQAQLREELSAFADLLADRLAEKLAETLPGSFENFKQQRDFALLQARSRAEVQLGKMIAGASVREVEAAAEAERKREARAELERTIDRSLLTPAEWARFEQGEDVPPDYSSRVEIKRQQEEEAELMSVDSTLLTEAEADAYFSRNELPPDYRDRALRARDKRRQQKRFAECYDRQDLLSADERMSFQLEGVIPADFEARLEKVETAAATRETGNLPGAELRPRVQP